jgi:hypothetical protein
MDDQPRRRRRVRRPGAPDAARPGSAAGATAAGPPARQPAPSAGPAPDPIDAANWLGEPAGAEFSSLERGLRGLVGGGSSQVSLTAALRARDAARPSADDLARSEAELAIIRRHWVPRD